MNILKGKKFGRLTVIKRVPNDKWGNVMWLCKCKCGAERTTREGDLKSGHTRSCGCLQKEGNINKIYELIKKNLVGQKFGRLIVIKRVNSNKFHQSMWLCRCDCGKEKIICGTNLRRGHTKSCGCLPRENARMGKNRKLSPKLANKKRTFDIYKYSAKKKGHDFNLTEEQFNEITQKDCYYCGAKPNNIAKRILLNQRKDSDDYIYNGIDRVDNSKGYTIDNIVPCCKICNFAKKNMSQKDFKGWIKRAYNKMFKKGNKNND